MDVGSRREKEAMPLPYQTNLFAFDFFALPYEMKMKEDQ
jgi:hypothetical protein